MMNKEEAINLAINQVEKELKENNLFTTEEISIVEDDYIVYAYTTNEYGSVIARSYPVQYDD